MTGRLQRAELTPLVGRVVTAEATYTPQTRRRDGTCLYLVRSVTIYPHWEADHFWLALPVKFARTLRNEQRFSFRARVDYYRRADGSRDVGLNDVWVL